MSADIAREVERLGGRAYFVGGFVRDELMGVNAGRVKDIDIEVHGLMPETLEKALGGLGEVTSMGASFGIFSLRHYHIDVAMPRKEHATGRGHRDFKVFVDPFIGPENAARRRDFTINAMMQDIITGRILDFFGGREDLAGKCLRHVNDDSFAEDPLRVFRGAQFAARFGFSLAPRTVRICAGMDVSQLSPERVFTETEKAFASGDPAAYFRVLRQTEQLSFWFPEILGSVRRDGGAERFFDFLRAASASAAEASDRVAFICAAVTFFLNDNPDGGCRDTAWLRRITNNSRLLKYAAGISGTAAAFAVEDSVDRKVLLLDGAVCPDDAALLAKIAGATDVDAALSIYKRFDAAPGVTGKDLIDAGVAPGPDFSEALALARRMQLSGRGRDEALAAAIDFLRKGDERI